MLGCAGSIGITDVSMTNQRLVVLDLSICNCSSPNVQHLPKNTGFYRHMYKLTVRQ